MASQITPPTIPQICLFSGVAGLLSHWVYFIHGEHHMEAARLLVLTLTAPLVTAAALVQYGGLGLLQAGTLSVLAVTSYLWSLWTSIIIYRVFFHRLRNFPGPFSAKISKLWHMSKLTANQDNFRQLEAVHQKYGDFVRTGPSEITIFAQEGPLALLGPSSKCIKSPWYDPGLPKCSLHSTRNKAAHDRRRRIWDRGFGAKALRTYEDRILSHTKILLQQLATMASTSVNVTKWFNFYSFDVMGDLAFGKSFGMLESGKSHHALDIVHEGLSVLGVLTPIPWIAVILARTPLLGKKFKDFDDWCEAQVEERKKMELSVPDVMSWLIDDFKKPEGSEFDQNWLIGDSKLIIVAGSDTTAATLTYAFYHLAHDPSQVKKLRAELSGLLQPSTDFSFNVKDIQDAGHLNGVINETLRLHPPVPSGTLRVTPPEGLMVGDTFIPGDITVVAPNYSIGRREDCYERASEFIPERWYSEPQLIKNKNAFAPFSLGPYSCIGKQLALMELRTVLALLVNKFDVAFAPGEDGSDLLHKSKDFFTICMEDLNLVFTPVEKITG